MEKFELELTATWWVWWKRSAICNVQSDIIIIKNFCTICIISYDGSVVDVENDNEINIVARTNVSDVNDRYGWDALDWLLQSFAGFIRFIVGMINICWMTYCSCWSHNCVDKNSMTQTVIYDDDVGVIAQKVVMMLR